MSSPSQVSPRSGKPDPEADRFLQAGQVRHRYSCSDMWLWRRQNDGSGFPRPIIISKRRFWRLSELIAWEAAQVERDCATEGPEGSPDARMGE